MDGGFGGFAPFVAVETSDAFGCLLFVFDSEKPENHGRVAVGIKSGDPLGHTLADIVEVGRVATDYAAEHNHGIVV